MATASEVSSAGTTPRRQLRRDISRVALLFSGIGSIIGSGWLFGAYRAAQHAGPASMISWAVGGVMVMFIGLAYAELGAMFPVSGGVVRFPHITHGSGTSYSVGWITWLAVVSVAPIEVEAALQYANNYWSIFSHTVAGVDVLTWPVGYIAAVVLMALFSLVNIVGIRFFARLNTPIVWWKLGIITLVVISLWVNSWHSGNFSSAGGFMPYGTHGMFEAVAVSGIVFSFLGFRQGVELAGESKDPQRNVPFAVIGSIVVTLVIYLALQAAFILGVLPKQLAGGWASVSFDVHGKAEHFGPLAGLATVLGMTWLAVLLYIDAFISPADTGLIYTTVSARVSYAMGRNENAPRQLASLNDRGVPWISVILTFICGLALFAPFPGWQKLVGFITSATVLSFASGPIVLSSLRRTMPELPRPFRLPASDLIAFLAFFSSNMIVYWSGWDTNWKLFAAIGIGFVLYAVWRLTTARDAHPVFDWKSFSWVPFWLGGLAAFSYVGSYPAKSSHAGNLGHFAFWNSWLIMAAFSIVIFAWGVAVRLPAERVRTHIDTLSADEPAAATPVEVGA